MHRALVQTLAAELGSDAQWPPQEPSTKLSSASFLYTVCRTAGAGCLILTGQAVQRAKTLLGFSFFPASGAADYQSQLEPRLVQAGYLTES